MYEIKPDWITFYEKPTKEELDNLPLLVVYYDCYYDCDYDYEELDENFKNSNIIDLEFGNFFDKPVDNLPKNLKILEFGTKFNQKVDNLPLTLKKLSFFQHFNQPLDFLPEGLEKLYIQNIDYSYDLLNLPKF